MNVIVQDSGFVADDWSGPLLDWEVATQGGADPETGVWAGCAKHRDSGTIAALFQFDFDDPRFLPLVPRWARIFHCTNIAHVGIFGAFARAWACVGRSIRNGAPCRV